MFYRVLVREMSECRRFVVDALALLLEQARGTASGWSSLTFVGRSFDKIYLGDETR